ncbi:MAG: glycosyltransferase [Beijerinckiaceae bacterium]|nr:glycosyltransferase [Beijerinckiaceae bacterium]
MKIAFYGSSLLSSYWNGAATYYRGLLREMARNGHEIHFHEPDAFDRQKHRDIEPPDWCAVDVYEASPRGLADAARKASRADVVVKTSGVGYADNELLASVLAHARADAITIFWDVDAPTTLAEISADPQHPLRAALARLDAVLTYGGGAPVVNAYRELGAAECAPIYNALDPLSHHQAPCEARFACDLAFLGNRLPDREARVTEFFLAPAQALQGKHFILGGAGWGDLPLPPNVRWLDHVPTRDHNALNASARAVLNVNRDSMAANGFSPPTRVFEAAGAGACLITDAWEGVEMFLSPGNEVLVARDGADVADILAGLSPERARAVGAAALARVRRDHTYAQRAREVNAVLNRLSRRKGEAA